MTRRLEYLDEALDEAEEAARWHAERSPTAASALTGELDVTAAAIEQAPEDLAAVRPWHTALPAADFRTSSCIALKRPGSSSWRLHTRIVDLVIGKIGSGLLANPRG